MSEYIIYLIRRNESNQEQEDKHMMIKSAQALCEYLNNLEELVKARKEEIKNDSYYESHTDDMEFALSSISEEKEIEKLSNMYEGIIWTENKWKPSGEFRKI